MESLWAWVLGAITKTWTSVLVWLLNKTQLRLGIDRDHDVAVFKKLDALADESRISNILNARIYTKRIQLQDNYTLSDLVQALGLIENRFLDTVLQQQAEALGKQMGSLLDFVQGTFFSVPPYDRKLVPESSDWLKFRPDPIASDVYDKEWEELQTKIDRAWEAYKAFRLSVKERLKV